MSSSADRKLLRKGAIEDGILEFGQRGADVRPAPESQWA
ncbi:hypothetical protein ABIA39_006822 [Nocardia sp. GAS34]